MRPISVAPQWLLRAEGAAVAVSMGVWPHSNPPGWVLAIAVLGRAGPEFHGLRCRAAGGSSINNAAQTYLGPVALVFLGGAFLLVSALRALHIGVDRALGSSLKHAHGFKQRRLGKVGL